MRLIFLPPYIFSRRSKRVTSSDLDGRNDPVPVADAAFEGLPGWAGSSLPLLSEDSSDPFSVAAGVGFVPFAAGFGDTFLTLL